MRVKVEPLCKNDVEASEKVPANNIYGVCKVIEHPSKQSEDRHQPKTALWFYDAQRPQDVNI
ncbi:hypothetical protein BTUL_0109g00330 [Botrytis tulipae]|uniref:Uncharacterized protein n=1 Tax=Botrytis tulipae TaxID=87230 RepID=A0A4Z1EGN6_9HELO|nr:hypothetical protein BTUL_0109g00330 [Botrytis tulipae]